MVLLKGISQNGWAGLCPAKVWESLKMGGIGLDFGITSINPIGNTSKDLQPLGLVERLRLSLGFSNSAALNGPRVGNKKISYKNTYIKFSSFSFLTEQESNSV